MSVPPYTSTVFLSTPSARRATSRRYRCCRSRPISIHALCEEGDGTSCTSICSPQHFYPRPLRGGRHLANDNTAVLVEFLSTPSARRATNQLLSRCIGGDISIHALCEEGDLACRCTSTAGRYFYPRPLRGGRHLDNPAINSDGDISIHALCEEGDPFCGFIVP